MGLCAAALLSEDQL